MGSPRALAADGPGGALAAVEQRSVRWRSFPDVVVAVVVAFAVVVVSSRSFVPLSLLFSLLLILWLPARLIVFVERFVFNRRVETQTPGHGTWTSLYVATQLEGRLLSKFITGKAFSHGGGGAK